MSTATAATPRADRPAVAAGHTVLAVDDEPRITQVVTRALRLDGIDADGAQDASAAVAMLAHRSYDLIILDLLMPGQDGFSVLGDILRLNPDQAVLVLSCLSDTPAKIRSLNLGAEDYLAKPFHVQELLARVHARMRVIDRRRQLTISHGRLTLDLIGHRVTVGQHGVQLTEREFQLLRELLAHPGEALPKAQLLGRVWGYQQGNPSNVVDVCVRRLRSRLGDEVIETVRGVGYRVP
jgi:DNA-binding response OmpR family regulator